MDTCRLHDDLAALGAGGEHLPHAYGYEPLQPRMFRAILRAAQIDPREFVAPRASSDTAATRWTWKSRPRQMEIAYRNARHSQVPDELAVLRCVVSTKSFSLYRQAGQEAVVPLEEARLVDTVPAA